MLLTLRMVAEVVVIALTTKLKEKKNLGLIGNFLCNFLCLVFLQVNYLFSPYLFT